MSSPTFFRQVLFASSLTLGLIGCSSDDGDSDSSDSHTDTHIETEGRLALFDQDANAVKILNLDNQEILATYPLEGSAARLYTSPEGRYAVAIQRDDNLVSFIDSGLYTEDHGDHLHDYAVDPSVLSFTLTGAKPTHYTMGEETSAIFFDGSDAESSSVVVLTDEAIGSGQQVASLDLESNMHGVAKLIEDTLYVTYRDASITDTTLPAHIERYGFDGSQFSFAHRYDETCPRLHGAAYNEETLVFGCSDGVLVVNLADQEAPAKKIDNPDSLIDDGRIGYIVAHHEQQEMVGVAGNQIFVINPEEDSIVEIKLPEDFQGLAYGFNQDGEVFYILGRDGVLRLYDVENVWADISLEVFASLDDNAISPVVALSGAEDALFISEPNSKNIIAVHLEEGEIENRFTIDFTASHITWTGLTAHDHE